MKKTTIDVFGVRILYKSGNSFEGFFTEFDIDGGSYTWKATAPPQIIFEKTQLYKDTPTEEQYCKYVKQINARVAKPLKIGAADIEAVFQTSYAQVQIWVNEE